MYSNEEMIVKLEEAMTEFDTCVKAEAVLERSKMKKIKLMGDLEAGQWANLSGKTDKAKRAELLTVDETYADAIDAIYKLDLAILPSHARTSAARMHLAVLQTIAKLIQD